eukprot:IDg4633t1
MPVSVRDEFISRNGKPWAANKIRDLVHSKELPWSISHINYEGFRAQGAPLHRDVNALFMVFIVILKQNAHQGPIRILDLNLSKSDQDPANVIAISPEVLHGVPILQRNANRLSWVFSF